MSKGLKVLSELKEYWLNHLPLSVKDGLRIVKVLEKELIESEKKDLILLLLLIVQLQH